MARPKKPINYEEQLFRIDAQITKWKNTIKELEEDRRALLQQQEREEIAQLYELYKSSGLTMSKITDMVESQISNQNCSESA